MKGYVPSKWGNGVCSLLFISLRYKLLRYIYFKLFFYWTLYHGCVFGRTSV
jgi:hypothetical protein